MMRLFLVAGTVVGLAGLSLGDEPKKLSDEEITKLMVGKWEDSARFGNVSIHTVEDFKKDGTLEREDTTNGKEKTHTTATWQVKDGVLTTVVVVEGFPGKGTTVKWAVTSIDDKTQVVESEGGAVVKKTRLAVPAAPMTAEKGSADDKPDARTYWAYEGGWFARSDDGSWYQMNEATFRKLGKPMKFGEAKRSNDFIDLYDDGSRTYVRLFADHAETLSRKGDWEKLYTGKWKTPE